VPDARVVEFPARVTGGDFTGDEVAQFDGDAREDTQPVGIETTVSAGPRRIAPGLPSSRREEIRLSARKRVVEAPVAVA